MLFMLFHILFEVKTVNSKVIFEAEPGIYFFFSYPLCLLKYFFNWSVSCICILSMLAYVVRE